MNCRIPPSLRPSLTWLVRSFSTGDARAGSAAIKLERLHRNVPEYPYGPRSSYKQSNFGLYAGRHIQFGNIVSEKFELKSRRSWKPNVHRKRLWSTALQRWLRIKVTTRALRTMDKVGGLDEYLLGEKPARIKELGMGGWLLRWRIMQTDVVRQRFAAQRAQMGLPPLPAADMVATSTDGRTVSEEELQQEIRDYDHTLQQNQPSLMVEKEDDEPVVEEDAHPNHQALDGKDNPNTTRVGTTEQPPTRLLDGQMAQVASNEGSVPRNAPDAP